MAAHIISAPTVTWSGSPIALISFDQATLNQTSGAAQYVTQTNVNKALADLRSWSGTLSGQLSTPITGSGLGITYSTGYAAFVESWSATINVAVEQYYTTASSDRWMEALPSTLSWSGSYTALVDEDAPIIAVGADATPAAMTFTLSSGNTLAGSVVSTSVVNDIPVGRLHRVTVQVQGDGTLTAAGSNNIISNGAIAPMTGATLTLNARESGTNDVEYSGTAFWNQLTVNAATAGLIKSSIGFQGSGALTIVTPTP
jgi:hypothetical protein